MQPHPLTQSSRKEQWFARGLALLFGLALALRAGYAWEVHDLPTFRYPVMDAATHLELARAIAAGAWLPLQPFYQAPFYPYFLALLERLTGTGPEAARIVQVLLSAAAPILIALATAPAFGRRAALFAGLLGALYGPQVVFAPLLLKETLALALLAAALALFAQALRVVPAPGVAGERAAARSSTARLLAIGLLLGLAAQLRENLIVLLPLAGLGIAWWAPRRRLAAALGVVLGGALALLPAAWANARVGGPWFLTSSQSGMNFYIGNVLSESGTYQPLSQGSQRPEAQREDARRMATALLAARDPAAEAGLALSDPAVSRVFWRESGRAIAAAPAAWCGKLTRKLWLFWSNYEVPDAEGWVVLRQLSAVLSLTPITFAPLLGLAAFGLLPAWRRDRRLSAVLLIATGATCISVVAFFVFARYRLPVVLFLLPFAGAAVAELLARARARRWGSVATGVAIIAVVSALSFTTPLTIKERAAYTSALWFNLGHAGNRESADELEQASHAAGSAERAQALDTASRSAATAASFLGLALEDSPEFLVARVERGVALERWGNAALLEGDAARAEALYVAAMEELDRVPQSGPGGIDPELASQVASLRAFTSAALVRARARLEPQAH